MISFHQDEEEPADWYASVSKNGFPVRADGRSGALHFNNAAISNLILDALEIEDNSAAFKVGAEPVEVKGVKYWPLITANPIIKTRTKK